MGALWNIYFNNTKKQKTYKETNGLMPRYQRFFITELASLKTWNPLAFIIGLIKHTVFQQLAALLILKIKAPIIGIWICFLPSIIFFSSGCCTSGSRKHGAIAAGICLAGVAIGMGKLNPICGNTKTGANKQSVHTHFYHPSTASPVQINCSLRGCDLYWKYFGQKQGIWPF